MYLSKAAAQQPLNTNSIQVPAPVGGWNARDAQDNMPPEDAVNMVNWFPATGVVETRRGYQTHASGMSGSIESLIEFNAQATRKLICAADGKFYDISTAGAVGAALASGFTNNRWQSAQFDISGSGSRIALVNGSDAPQQYDGTTVSALTISGTGLTPSNLIGVNIFKNRAFYWEKNSQDFWYSSINALAGTLTKFPLGRISSFGGNLVSMATWTQDGGDGVNDYAVFLMSSGDVIVYQGSDPGAAADWALVGRFRLGSCLDVRGVVQFGSDLIAMTREGYYPLSLVLSKARSNDLGAVSDKINGAVKEVARSYAANKGWQAILYPRGNWLLFNVPVSAARFDQHVMNTQTGAWTKFEGMNGACWGLYNEEIYFGGTDGKVYKADVGLNDGGKAIIFTAQTAWNYFGNRERIKRFTGIKPTFESETELPVSIALGYDFRAQAVNFTTSQLVGDDSPWDDSPWDDTSWAPDSGIISPWVSAAGLGRCVSARVVSSLNGQSCKWYSITYLMQAGDFI
ncbi:hypothetical protein UFOVP413_24 [uncultured Caudovirales phage]|uniref:Uncharacterized protein n=1 Tax=uncultured Caudovirales phage TaxID=2100421 RepID=A0A6J5M340_9CAUD|nr:hypothetical protein UFOVP413_24 [uncultured Caudovirales phage]